MLMAIAKQATTIATQRTRAARDLAVEMCTRPWIVELSRNSHRVAVAILTRTEQIVDQNIVSLANMVLILLVHCSR